jgi:hypothetical protein
MSDLTSPKNPFMKPEFVILLALAGWKFKDRRAAELAVIAAHNMARVPRKPVIVVRGPAGVGKTWFTRHLLGCVAAVDGAHARTVVQACTEGHNVCVDNVRATRSRGIAHELYCAMMYARHQRLDVQFGLGPRAKRVVGENTAALVLTTSDETFPRRHGDLCMINVDIVERRDSRDPTVPLQDVADAAREVFAWDPNRDWWDLVRAFEAGAEVLP